MNFFFLSVWFPEAYLEFLSFSAFLPLLVLLLSSFFLSLHLSSYFLTPPPPASSSFFFPLLLPSSHLFFLSCRLLRSPFAIRRFLTRFFLASFSFSLREFSCQFLGFSRLTSLIQPRHIKSQRLLLRFLYQSWFTLIYLVSFIFCLFSPFFLSQ